MPNSRHDAWAIRSACLLSLLVSCTAVDPGDTGAASPVAKSVPAGGGGLTELAAQIGESVATVHSLDGAGAEIGQGTGFLVGESLLLTCRHVVENARKVVVEFHGASRNYAAIGVARDYPAQDLVLIALDPGYFDRPFLARSDRQIRRGEEVVVLGSPQGLDQSLATGLVASIRENSPLGRLIQITAPISEGSSGSPVCDGEGRVIGVVTSKIPDGNGLGFAVPIGKMPSNVDLGTVVPWSDWVGGSARTEAVEDAERIVGGVRFQRHVNPDHGFTIDFPAGWTIKDGVSADTAVKAVAPDKQNGIRLISVSFTDLGAAIDLRDLDPMEMASTFAGATGSAEVEVIEVGRSSLSGGESTIWAVTKARHPVTGELMMLTSFLTRGKALYWIVGATDRGARSLVEWRPVFEASIRSFSFSDRRTVVPSETEDRSDVSLLDYDEALQAESGLPNPNDRLALTRFIVQRRQAHMEHMRALPITEVEPMLFYITRVLDAVRRKYPVAYLDILGRSNQDAGGLPRERRYEMALLLVQPAEVDLTPDYSGPSERTPMWLRRDLAPPWNSLDREVRKKWRLDDGVPPEVKK